MDVVKGNRKELKEEKKRWMKERTRMRNKSARRIKVRTCVKDLELEKTSRMSRVQIEKKEKKGNRLWYIASL